MRLAWVQWLKFGWYVIVDAIEVMTQQGWLFEGSTTGYSNVKWSHHRKTLIVGYPIHCLKSLTLQHLNPNSQHPKSLSCLQRARWGLSHCDWPLCSDWGLTSRPCCLFACQCGEPVWPRKGWNESEGDLPTQSPSEGQSKSPAESPWLIMQTIKCVVEWVERRFTVQTVTITKNQSIHLQMQTPPTMDHKWRR